MSKNDWIYYNHGLISNKMPHEEKNIDNIEENTDWKKNKTLFARWTSNFDCGYETQWWYCIKDDNYDIEKLKSKRRYVINKGIKNFDVKIINPKEYEDELYGIYTESLKEYPEKYRVILTKDEFLKDNISFNQIYIGAFDIEDNLLSGYSICEKIENSTDKIINLKVVKVKPEATKKEINAAILNFICIEFLNKQKVKYICDGERNIRHITNYQDYLIKYFDFRKAYCKLNIKYKLIMKIAVYILYPLKNIIKNTNNKLLYNIYCVLYQEQIRRSFK